MSHRGETFVVLVDTSEPHLERGDGPETVFTPQLFRPAAKGSPSRFEPAPTRRANLMTGDYSLPGLEGVVAIERKTLPDLIGTLFSGKANSVGDQRAESLRFTAELERMRDMPPGSFAYIVVEASPDDVSRELYKRPKNWGAEVALARRFDSEYAGSFAEGAIRCEECPGYRWPGHRCYNCAARPPGELLYDRVSSQAILRFAWKLELTYGVPWVWAGSRGGAEQWVGNQLETIWLQSLGHGEEYRKAVERGMLRRRPWVRDPMDGFMAAAQVGELAGKVA